LKISGDGEGGERGALERGAGEAGRKSFCSPGTGEQNRTGELPFPTLVTIVTKLLVRIFGEDAWSKFVFWAKISICDQDFNLRSTFRF